MLGHGRKDVLIEGGRITAIDQITSQVDPGRAERIDVTGLVVAPGFVDLHTHLREPGREDAETIATGSAAAAAGGYVAVVAMPNTDPCADTAAVVARVRDEGGRVGLCRVIPSGAISVGRMGATLAPMGELAAEGVRVFTDDGTCVASARLMRRALEYVRAFPAVVANHAEDADLCDGGVAHEGPVAERLGLRGRPPEAEEIIVARDIALARATGGRLHVLHISTAAAADLVRTAKSEGVAVTSEVAPHHLYLTEDELESWDPVYRVNPPLRQQADVDALQLALADGTIDAIATDHAPHAAADKEREFDLAPPGMIGLETAFAGARTAMADMGIGDLVDRLSTAPARILGLSDEFGGPIAAGRPAHLAVLAPDERWTPAPSDLHSRSANCPWLGRELTGRVRMTIYSGRITHRG